jgi:hypothetical protein
MTDSRRAYQLAGTRCPECGCTGSFLLDRSDSFTVSGDGEITFPPGEWGLDIDCDCPACGFAARLGDFYEWVEVTGEERMEAVRASRKAWGR